METVIIGKFVFEMSNDMIGCSSVLSIQLPTMLATRRPGPCRLTFEALFRHLTILISLVSPKGLHFNIICQDIQHSTYTEVFLLLQPAMRTAQIIFQWIFFWFYIFFLIYIRNFQDPSHLFIADSVAYAYSVLLQELDLKITILVLNEFKEVWGSACWVNSTKLKVIFIFIDLF